MSKISAKRVREILSNCFFKQLNVGAVGIKVEGIMNTFVFDPEKVKEYEGEILSYLIELNEDIREDKGGGISLIMIPMDKNDDQWGEQQNADELMCLGMAIGRIKYLIEERAMWRIFPGAVPYYVFTNEKFEPETITITKEMVQSVGGGK